ncbi:MAG: winged helix-turn-helix transcriptional regulator [Firmicutes bacterium]|jgi:DNA-binding transcriptional ArsR family regulator|nr:winged helix-turn-helix transcriptional regulator [Bacillota bacterium]MBQ1630415.1 winged helix-turn-helix transcriptional regulator [Bacillota bacterium]MBQ1689913.1 winged helix-turn-helix transcriptional regulator [Bacillota bacterium]MBQ1715961.1 winged helix-turn-helix transcriptional regulator [Bacillota bacterium]MBQ1826196.1 winged helix-turn-helix transcriptional regulator [Bacillota bacterium]
MRIRRDKNDFEEDEIVLIADVSDSLAHPLRVKMLKYIMKANLDLRGVCTKDLVEEFGYAQATVSQHMKKLIQSGLVEVRHEHKFNYYYVNFGLFVRYADLAKRFTME